MQHLVGTFTVSERRGCRLVQLQRSTWFYRAHRREDPALRMRRRELAQARPRFGYLRLQVMLRREGWAMNKTRVHRILPPVPMELGDRWSMDFVADPLLDGCRIRALTVWDTDCKQWSQRPRARKGSWKT